ncbi:hypothetical protein [Bacillus sp. JJ1764]|uniref:hypothetical protein n=1 Tax=Bacillus sp. JJ1764 TaxID=3122964 RepID=UPI0030004834
MKKLISVVMGALVAFSLFAVTGTPVKAATAQSFTASLTSSVHESDCHCDDVTPIVGAEKNKTVASVISSKVFKDVKQSIIKDGNSWRGVSNAEVYYQNYYHVTIVGFPYYDKDGTVMMAVFFDGVYKGSAPK